MIQTLSRSTHRWWMAGVGALLFATTVVTAPRTAAPQNIKTHEEAARILVIEKLAVNDGAVSGEIYNRSTRLVRDVQLFIRYAWFWDDEMKPGKDDPGTSIYYNLQKEIPAGGRMAFNFKPSPPLTKASGGRYETSVTIAGFTEVIPPTK